MRNKLHIVTKYFYPIQGGIENSILLLAEQLVVLGWEVHVHTLLSSRDGAAEPTQLYKGISISRYKNVGLLKLGRLFRGTDVVWFHNFNLFPHIPLLIAIALSNLFARKKIRVVLTPHGGFTPNWSKFTLVQKAIKSALHKFLGLMLIRHVVDKVQAVSEWEKEVLQDAGVPNKKVFIAPNPLEPSAFLEHSPTEGTYILQIGNIAKHKNILSSIKALPHLPSNVALKILANKTENEYLSEVTQLAKSLGVLERVQILDKKISLDEKYSLIAGALLVVNIPLWESYGTAVIESMSQGAFVIVSKGTNTENFVKRSGSGYIIDPEDSEMLSEKINDVLANVTSDKILNMKLSAKEYANNFSALEIATNLDKVLKEI